MSLTDVLGFFFTALTMFLSSTAVIFPGRPVRFLLLKYSYKDVSQKRKREKEMTRLKSIRTNSKYFCERISVNSSLLASQGCSCYMQLIENLGGYLQHHYRG